MLTWSAILMIQEKLSFSFILFLVSLQALGQNIGIGEWQIHLPYKNTIEVKEAGSRMYCATENAVFYYDTEDNSVNRLSKVTGLSDVGVSAIGYRDEGDILVIAYSNSNIDLVKNGNIINISDINGNLSQSVISSRVIDKQ